MSYSPESTVELRSPRGPQTRKFSLRVLCDDQPCEAVSLFDPGTRRNTVRFVTKGAGELKFQVHNLGVSPVAVFRLFKAELKPGELWAPRHLLQGTVNRINCLELGDSYTVRRDDTTGRAIRVEPMRDARGRLVRDPQVVAQQIPRTKWLLHVVPAEEEDGDDGEDDDDDEEEDDVACKLKPPLENLGLSSWVVKKYRGSEVTSTLSVKTPNGTVDLSVGADEIVDSLLSRLENLLGVPVEDQFVRSATGRRLKREEQIVGKRWQSFASVFFCERKARPGPKIWLFVKTNDGTIVVDRKSSDSVRSVFEEVLLRYKTQCERWTLSVTDGEYALYRGTEMLPMDKSLQECGLLCLSSLSLAKVGSIKLNFICESASVSFFAHPSDTVSHVKYEIQHRLNSKIFCDQVNYLFLGSELKNSEVLSDVLSNVTLPATFSLKIRGSIKVTVVVSLGRLFDPNHVVTICVDHQDTLRDCREKMIFLLEESKLCSASSWLRSNRMTFYKDSNRLDDDVTIAQLGIVDDCKLDFMPRTEAARCSPKRFKNINGAGSRKPFHIVVYTQTLKAIDIPCEPSDEIRRIKFWINVADGTSEYLQRLLYNGNQLEDGSTLSDYNLKSGSLLEMYIPVCGGGSMDVVEDDAYYEDGSEDEAEGREPIPVEGPQPKGNGTGTSVNELVVGKIVSGIKLRPPESRSSGCVVANEYGNYEFQFEVYVDPLFLKAG